MCSLHLFWMLVVRTCELHAPRQLRLILVPLQSKFQNNFLAAYSPILIFLYVQTFQLSANSSLVCFSSFHSSLEHQSIQFQLCLFHKFDLEIESLRMRVLSLTQQQSLLKSYCILYSINEISKLRVLSVGTLCWVVGCLSTVSAANDQALFASSLGNSQIGSRAYDYQRPACLSLIRPPDIKALSALHLLISLIDARFKCQICCMSHYQS